MLPYNSNHLMEVYLGTKHKDNSVVSIAGAVRLKHLAAFGKTGVGKTTLLRNMAYADLVGGNGFTVIDPHGSLVQDLLQSIPRHRTHDVIWIDPAHTERVIGLNVLEAVHHDHHHLVVSSLISILRNLYPDNWGPRTEWILEHAVYALLEQPQPATLVALPKLLSDELYRKEILKQVTNPVVKEFFRFYDAQNDRLREESITPLLNKVAKFNLNPLLRTVVGQSESTFNFREAMDRGQIILCSLSKGALGEDVSSLLGSLIVTKLALAALSREDTPEQDRRPHFLYADEIQNFVHGVDFPTILSEARKYRLSLTIATQTLSQLPERSLQAVIGNCATIISFRVSGEDAKALVREFAASGEGPQTGETMYDLVLPAAELQNLPDYQCYVRTLSDGRPEEAFLVRSFPSLSGDSTRVAIPAGVIRASIQRFGRDRTKVEKDIYNFLNRAV